MSSFLSVASPINLFRTTHIQQSVSLMTIEANCAIQVFHSVTFLTPSVGERVGGRLVILLSFCALCSSSFFCSCLFLPVDVVSVAVFVSLGPASDGQNRFESNSCDAATNERRKAKTLGSDIRSLRITSTPSSVQTGNHAPTGRIFQARLIYFCRFIGACYYSSLCVPFVIRKPCSSKGVKP